MFIYNVCTVIAMIDDVSITFIVIVGNFVKHDVFFHVWVHVHILDFDHFAINLMIYELYKVLNFTTRIEGVH